MQKDDLSFHNVIGIASGTSALILTIVHLLLLELSGNKEFALNLFIINTAHLSLGLLFTLQLTQEKLMGNPLFGHTDRNIQSTVIYKMTFIVFSLLFFNLQTLLFQSKEHLTEQLTEAFLFSIFITGGFAYIMLWGLDQFIRNKKEKKQEEEKETIQLFGLCYISIFEDSMHELSNALYALTKIEETLTQKQIVEINKKTDALKNMVHMYKKMSVPAQNQVNEHVFETIHTFKNEVEKVLFSKDEEYIKCIKRQAERINRKTV